MREGNVNDILVENVEIIDPTYAGIEFRGFGTAFVPPGERISPEYLAAADSASYANVTLRNVAVTNAGTNGIEIVDNAGRGNVTFDTVSVSGSQGLPLAQGNASAAFFHLVGANTGWAPGGGGGGGGSDSGSGSGSGGGGGGPVNLALHKPVTESSHTQNLVATNVTDGDQTTYWESTNNAFPQTLTVDLGATMSVDRVVLKLPIANWAARTQTLSVLGSTDGSTFTTLVASRGAAFDPASSSTATITFTATAQRFLRLNFTANTGWPAGQLAEFEVYGPAGGGGGGGGTVNLALQKPITESSHTQNLVATNANDGTQSSYWESANNAFPQTLTVDLGAAVTVNRVVLKLPVAGWGARTQTLSLLGSANGTAFTTLVASSGATFDPATSNTATITFAATSQRFLRLNFTANTGWPAGQLSEFEVYGP